MQVSRRWLESETQRLPRPAAGSHIIPSSSLCQPHPLLSLISCTSTDNLYSVLSSYHRHNTGHPIPTIITPNNTYYSYRTWHLPAHLNPKVSRLRCGLLRLILQNEPNQSPVHPRMLTKRRRESEGEAEAEVEVEGAEGVTMNLIGRTRLRILNQLIFKTSQLRNLQSILQSPRRLINLHQWKHQ